MTPGVQARQFERRMKFFVTGLSYKTTPVEMRKRLAVLPSPTWFSLHFFQPAACG
jgi:hypothetical protein